jgi:hypothetical protein
VTALMVFIDTETTSLRPDRRAWEVALIRREPGQPESEHRWFVHHDDLDLGNADLFSLRVGRFHERHPQAEGVDGEKRVMRCVEELTRGAVLVGAVPSFDAEVLAARMRACGVAPSWHYQVQDFETLIAGFLRGQGKPVPGLPWKSDDLSRLAGVEPPGEDERHTALGDARWALRAWDAVMGGP